MAFLLAGASISGASPVTPAAAEVRDRYGIAVIIGNKTYSNKRVPQVSYAHEDADAFRRYVDDVLGYRAANILDLRDATQGQIESVFGNERSHEGKLWRFLDPKGRSDVVVFYSGHGVPGLKDKRGYLLPADASPDTAEINGYPVDLLYKNLRKLKESKSIAVFLDACFSGDSHKGMLVRSASPVFIKVVLPTAGKKMMVLTAASADEVASWDETAKHGLFTEHLLDALYGKADANRDGRVTGLEAKSYLDDTMTAAARRIFGRYQNASLNGAADMALSVASGRSFPTRPIELTALTPKLSRPAPTSPPVAVEPDPVSVERGLDLSRADRVFVQRGLNGLQLDAGPADGLYGPKTRDAIGKWQVSKGYSGTGYLTGDQAKALVSTGRETQVAVGIYPGSPGIVHAASRSVGGPGSVFRDCANCPEMVVIPAGSFRMGDLSGGGDADEKPVHGVTISRSFAVGKFEVTFSEWDACVSSGGCRHRPGDNGWGRGSRPVMNVSWNDAQAYIKWLSGKTGKGYRLLSESEWEYVARAGSNTKYPWGNEVGNNRANCDGCGSSWDGKQTAPAGSFSANGFGLHDMIGNVWEWVGDCWNGNYAGAPSDGSARMDGVCSLRVLRGGSWDFKPRNVRSALRNWYRSGSRSSLLGFRLARTL